ncbi:9035_t:CDS:10 [Paraglomus brasilianum]|uniref:9035_t:CDS:1 n=1 Tax=Paraglomus brasilianum TaxID=144538 RepID=A0A9N9AYC7_9GLOM|nr:9035_t:CDS:10 [Paraglomus brasilianum]
MPEVRAQPIRRSSDASSSSRTSHTTKATRRVSDVSSSSSRPSLTTRRISDVSSSSSASVPSRRTRDTNQRIRKVVPTSSAQPRQSTQQSSSTRSRAHANPLELLKKSVADIFDDVQKSAVLHRKNALALRKIQERCSINPSIGEQAFNKTILDMVQKILSVKKKEPCVDRTVKFLGAFIQYTSEKDAKDNDSVNSDDEGTLSSRLVQELAKYLLKGIEAKERLIRLRICQLLGHCAYALDSINDSLYNKMRKKLADRIHDKDTGVRVQAVVALSKFQAGCDVENGDSREITDKLLDVLQYDPNAEVRRAVLTHIDYNENTMPKVLERAHDTDTTIRKYVFSKSLDELEDFRFLSIEEREQVLRWGLSDRDKNVKNACSNLLTSNWITQTNDNIFELVGRLDVINSVVAKDVVMELLRNRRDLAEKIVFDDEFWDNLTVERAFLARVFCEYLKEDENQLGEKMPEVTRLALCIQNYNNLLSQSLDDEDTTVKYEFMLEQLLIIATMLDYGDEGGRRQMNNLLREMLMCDITDSFIDHIVETMRKMAIDERDFNRVMIEIISDIREGYDNETDNFAEDRSRMTLDDDVASIRSRLSRSSIHMAENINEDEDDADKEIQSMEADLKSLAIMKCMLEINQQQMDDTSPVFALLRNLVVPSIQCPEPVLREMGMHCLGLTCLQNLASNLVAIENLDLFLYCSQNGPDELKIKCLMILFDIIRVFGYNRIVERSGKADEFCKLWKTSLDHDLPEMRAVAVEGMSKLLLTRSWEDKETLRKLVYLYFDPNTASNNRLRQCLSYFLPVYCHSSPKNQKIMCENFPSCLAELIKTHKLLSKHYDMVPPLQIAQQMIEWTDPHKLVTTGRDNEVIDLGIQADVAIGVLKLVYTETNKEVRKVLSQVLTKFRIDEHVGRARIKQLTLLAGNLKTRRPLKESVGKNALNKFEKTLLQYFSDSPESLAEEELAHIEEIKIFVESFEDEEDDDEDDERLMVDLPVRSTRSRESKAAALANLHREIDAMLDSSSEGEDSPSEREE